MYIQILEIHVYIIHVYRGVATLGSSRHVPTHNFHKILRKICIKWNVYIFLGLTGFFSKIGNEIVTQLDFSSYTEIIISRRQ